MAIYIEIYFAFTAKTLHSKSNIMLHILFTIENRKSYPMHWRDNALMPSKTFLNIFPIFTKKYQSRDLPFNRFLGQPMGHIYVRYHLSPAMRWWNIVFTESVDRQMEREMDRQRDTDDCNTPQAFWAES